MCTVTALRPRGHSKDRFVVELDGDAGPVVDAVLWLAHSLHVGDALDDAALARLADDAGRLAAKDRATRMLAARGRSREELRRKLVQKGVLPAHAAEAVESLAKAGLLDDAAYAATFARHRALAGHGRTRIAADLARAGVAKSIATEAIDRALADSSIDPDDAVRRLVERRLRALARFDRATRARRLAAFLARRGHRPSLAWKFVEGRPT